jgi:carbonic anhydrase
MKIVKYLTWTLLSVLIAMTHGIAATPGGHSAHWGYTGDVGPSQWGHLSPDYATCSTGQSQSPINIVPSQTVQASGKDLAFGYASTPLSMVNNGHTIQVNDTSDSVVLIAGRPYKLLQFHFHSPSENTYQGQHYPMEVHLVHRNARGSLAVVGIFLTQGAHNPFVQTLWDHMPKTANQNPSVSDSMITPAALLPPNGAYYHFQGSLTTPPCTEGVQWYILQSPIEVSEAQARQFVSVIGENARPVQPLNGRTVTTVGAGPVSIGTVAAASHTSGQVPIGHDAQALAQGHMASVPAPSHTTANTAAKASSTATYHSRPATKQMRWSDHSKQAAVRVSHNGGNWWYVVVGLGFLGLMAALVYPKAHVTDADGNRRLAFTVGARVLVGSGLILALLIGLSMFSIAKMDALGKTVTEVADIDIKLTSTVTKVAESKLEQSIWAERVFRYSAAPGDQAKEKYRRAIEEFRKTAYEVDARVAEGTTYLSGLSLSSDKQATHVQKLIDQLRSIEQEHQNYDDHIEQIFSLLDAGQIAQAHALEEQTEAVETKLDHLVENVLAEAEDRSVAASHNAELVIAATLRWSLIFSGLAVLIGLSAAWINGNSIARPVAAISKIAQSIAAGDTERQVDIHRQDEIGTLADAFRSLLVYIKEMAGAAQAISQGDLSLQVEARSERDVLAKSFARAANTDPDYICSVRTIGCTW